MSDSSNEKKTLCKIELQCSDILKIRGNDELYKEAIQQSAKFNRQFINDRKTRIPLLDAQTRIAQSNCTLWNIRYLRKNPLKQSQIYEYSVKKWIKNRRNIFDKESLVNYHHGGCSLNETGNENDSNLKPSPQYNNISGNNKNNNYSNSVNNGGVNTDMNNWYDDISCENVEMNDLDNDSEKTSKRQKSGRKKNKPNPDEKPFVCDKCGAKYKTKPGLSYHMLNFHVLGNGHKTNLDHLNVDENTNSINGSVYDDAIGS